jgi:acetyl-CoA carboxylase biotin carboxyl carrier protein
VTATGRPTVDERDRPGRPSAVPAADIRELVRSLITMMADGGITELDLALGDFSVRLRGRTTESPTPPAVDALTDVAELPRIPDAGEFVITAPMIGTFYSAPSPGDPPFVRVGDAVEVGQVVGVIEAMKIMNEIVADRPGIVVEILVANAQPVEYGSALIRLAPIADDVV